MDPRFNDIFSSEANQIFKVVFFPDRIYHSEYLNATRSPRYRYNVQEVRGYLDMTVLKGEIYLDGARLAGFVRVEYRGARLVEQTRVKNRFLGDRLLCWLKLHDATDSTMPESRITLHWDPWVEAYQAEVWETLEVPGTTRHDFTVLDMMGSDGSITCVQDFAPLLADPMHIRRIELAFREALVNEPFGTNISDAEAAWDNDYLRSHQEPRDPQPSSPLNTVADQHYLLDFQRGWFKDAKDITPVRYRNAMMDSDNPDAGQDNVILMRWLFQREFGGSMIFFHEVTVPPGKIEGNHQHIGSEELYYVVSGEGIAYLRVGDDPATDEKNPDGSDRYAIEERHVMGLSPYQFRRLPVRAGNMIFTKSGGMHGIRNTSSTEDLKFVAFLYHSR